MFLTGSQAASGSEQLVYYTSSYGSYAPSTLILSGNMIITGAISASTYHIEDIAIIDATGSTYFGDSNDDVHIRTGSLVVGNASDEVVFQVDISDKQVETNGLSVGYYTVTASLHTSSTSDYVLGVTATSDPILCIHSASVAGAGSLMVIKDELTTRLGVIQLSASTGELIDGTAAYEMTGSLVAISLYSNGTDWYIF
jgi:hypothetical protein